MIVESIFSISDSDWIKANENRQFRVRRSGSPSVWAQGLQIRNLIAATVISISQSRRTWELQDILIADEIIDTDDAAKQALRCWDEFLFPRLLDEARRRCGDQGSAQ